MTAGRVPRDLAPNAWTRALERRRRSGAVLLDLTEQNPTRLGLGGAGPDELAALADPQSARYDPEPLGLGPAREAIARYYASRGLSVDPGALVLTASTSEAYAHLFRLLCDPGDRVLVPAPGYPLFEPLAVLEAVETASLALVYDSRWRLDLDALEAHVAPRTRAVVVVQPHHPTGSCLSADEIARLDRLCARRGLAIIADEVFGDFLWAAGGGPPGPAPSLLGPREAQVFVLHGLSKLCGMPQLKLSWIALAGPSASRARALAGLEWIADAFLSVSTPVQRALPRLLEARHEFRRRVLERVATNRRTLARALEAAGAEVLPAEGGWAAVVRVPETSAEALALALLERDVVIHPGHFYDFADDAHLVVSLLPFPPDVEAGIERLAAVLLRRDPS